eukprot:209136_1
MSLTPTNIYEFQQENRKDFTIKYDQFQCSKQTTQHTQCFKSPQSISETQTISTTTLHSIEQCDYKISQNCCHLNRFIAVMKSYNKFKQDTNNMFDNKSINIIHTLNDYIHLLEYHQNCQQFEFIFEKLGYCDIKKCLLFKRNANQLNVSCHILDKMHCYFQHCYDIGHRLSLKDKSEITKSDKYVRENELINTKLVKTNNILSKKRREIKGIINFKKHNQLVKCKKNKLNMYSFGIWFKYGYNSEDENIYINQYVDYIPVSPKYNSLKEELTTNIISKISMNQFNIELKKASIHFSSDYCKQKFIPIKQWY